MSHVTTLILPGLGNSGLDHWQSHWERRDSTCIRVMQENWDTPACADWVARLETTTAASGVPLILVSHSSSCALVAHWVTTAPSESLSKVRGALLVAPSDPDGPNYPVGPSGFSPMPDQPLPFPTIVVASDDDPYVSLDRAAEFAAQWGAMLITMHAAGHINAASGHGAWPDGFQLLESLRARAVAALERRQS